MALGVARPPARWQHGKRQAGLQASHQESKQVSSGLTLRGPSQRARQFSSCPPQMALGLHRFAAQATALRPELRSTDHSGAAAAGRQCAGPNGAPNSRRVAMAGARGAGRDQSLPGGPPGVWANTWPSRCFSSPGTSLNTPGDTSTPASSRQPNRQHLQVSSWRLCPLLAPAFPRTHKGAFQPPGITCFGSDGCAAWRCCNRTQTASLPTRT